MKEKIKKIKSIFLEYHLPLLFYLLVAIGFPFLVMSVADNFNFYGGVITGIWVSVVTWWFFKQTSE